MKLKLIQVILLFISLSLCKAQNVSKIKFGDIKLEDFKTTESVLKEDDAAVILSDVGSTQFEGNNHGDFTLIFKRHKRILIKSKNAFDLATVKVRVYQGRSLEEEEKFEDFQAATYNIENGQVSSAKLDKSSVFTEKYNKVVSYKKFTFSNLKEGSIIEYSYTIKSPYYRYLRSWAFQDKYPVLWSEYQVTIPPMFNYLVLRKGLLDKYSIDSAKTFFKRYSVFVPSRDAYASDNIVNFTGDAIWHLWALKNAPAFKNESFTSSEDNYFTRIEFQLVSIKYSDSYTYKAMKSWPEVAADLMKDEDFGLALSQDYSWLKDEVKKIVGNSVELEAAKKIYAYVRDNFSCNNHEALYTSTTLKKTFQNKAGNVADINILLTAMLKTNGLIADPVILSTRDNGFVDEAMPLLNQYNYVISKTEVDSKTYLLDASNSKLGFGKIPEYSYNRTGRMIAEMPYLVQLSPDSLTETKQTNIIIINSDKGKLEGAYTSNLGYYKSLLLREKLTNKKQEDFFKEIEKSYSVPLKIENTSLDSLKQYDNNVAVKYEFNLDLGDEETIYFSPMFTELLKENPFKSAERNYPVEMPYSIDELFSLNIAIPKGYKVDELPKSARVKLNESDGMFEYLVGANSESVQLRCRLVINKATFLPEDYDTLREFYSYVVKKEAEQIVFKKAK